MSSQLTGRRAARDSGCSEQIDPSRLMCSCPLVCGDLGAGHLVWATWRSGEGTLTSDNREAVRDGSPGHEPAGEVASS
jgi:hypothetical protein